MDFVSRFFEFIQSVNATAGECRSVGSEAHPEPDGDNSVAGQILSVLQQPNFGAPAKNIAHVAEPSPAPVNEIEVRPELRVIVHTDSSSPATDRFRLLQMHLRDLGTAGTLKSLLITSPLPGDGKSTIALNVASVLAEKGKRSVLLIDADFYQHGITKLLGLVGVPGVVDCLQGACNPMTAIRRIEPLGWCLLPSGPASGTPADLLQPERLTNFMRTLSHQFDWIVLDSPPVLPVTDSISLAQHVDGTLLVVRAGKTAKKAIEDTLALLGRQRVLGMVLNGIESLNQTYSKYKGYYKKQPKSLRPAEKNIAVRGKASERVQLDVAELELKDDTGGSAASVCRPLHVTAAGPESRKLCVSRQA